MTAARKTPLRRFARRTQLERIEAARQSLRHLDTPGGTAGVAAYLATELAARALTADRETAARLLRALNEIEFATR